MKLIHLPIRLSFSNRSFFSLGVVVRKVYIILNTSKFISMLFTFIFLDNVCAFTKTKKSVNDFRWQFRVLSAYAFVFWKIFEHVSNLPPKIRQTKRMKIMNEKISGLQKNWRDFYNLLQKLFRCCLTWVRWDQLIGLLPAGSTDWFYPRQ